MARAATKARALNCILKYRYERLRVATMFLCRKGERVDQRSGAREEPEEQPGNDSVDRAYKAEDEGRGEGNRRNAGSWSLLKQEPKQAEPQPQQIAMPTPRWS
jgi:hypothetical protein